MRASIGEWGLLVPLVAILALGAADAGSVLGRQHAFATMLADVGTAAPADLDDPTALVAAAAARWPDATYAARRVDASTLRLDGTAAHRPPFGLIGAAITLRHTVFVRVDPPRAAPTNTTSANTASTPDTP